jgi:MYXO-CTERM domain-containing protein
MAIANASIMRALILLPVVAALFVSAAPAAACPAMPGPDAIFSVNISAKTHLPKNLGIPFSMYVGTNVTEASVQTRVLVTATPETGGPPIAGTMHAIQGNSFYLWVPSSGTLPIGTLQLGVTVDGAPLNTDPVTVDDRTLVPNAPPAHLDVTRQLDGNPSSPKIHCVPYVTPSTCGGSFEPYDLPSEQTAKPLLTVTVDADATDRIFFSHQMTMTGRGSDGGAAPEIALPAGQLESELDHIYDEYCVLLTTSVLGSAEKAVSQSICTKTAIDPIVTAEENTKFVHDEVLSCQSVTYPTGAPEGDPGPSSSSGGTKATDGTTPSSSNDTGCSCRTSGQSTPFGGLGLLLAVAAIVRRLTSR